MWVGMGQLAPVDETTIEDYPELFPREMYGGEVPREPISRGDIYYPVSTVPSVPSRQSGGTVTTLPGQLPAVPVPAPVSIVPLPPVPAPTGTVMPATVPQPTAKPNNLVIWLLVGVGAYFILKGQ